MVLKLIPAVKDYIWGGERLKTQWGLKTPLSPAAEAWLISAHPDGPSTIQNQPFAGQTLPQFLAQNPAALGTANGGDMPVLVKFIDAKQPLSVQLHPDDAYAERVEHEHGKTEMWYVADCEPGSFLYVGLKQAVTKSRLESAIANGSIERLLRRVDAAPGSCAFVPAKTLHAIGAGCLILEIQQSSNATYRVYDYGRTGPDGKPRELHVQKALEVADLTAANPAPPPAPTALAGGNTATTLADCPYFRTVKYDIAERLALEIGERSFCGLVVLEGAGRLICGEQALEFKKGDAFFAAAGSGQLLLQGRCAVATIDRRGNVV